MFKFNWKPLIIVLSLFVGFSGNALAQTETPTVTRFNLSEVTCKNLLDANNFDRMAVLMMYWGFVAGKENNLEFDSEKMQAATEQLMDVCVEDPDMTIFSAIESI
ncbi:HdeA/HdeB family chaperone [Crocosphaera chwakensis]|nr:HdeA/HdeB family chaperone [Crocosphaera chwakensis]